MKPKQKGATKKVQPEQHSKSRIVATYPAEWKNMINWLMVLATVLPLLFSGATMDPVVSIRHLFLSWFVLSFVLFFYIAKKTKVHLAFPALVKFVFLAGVAYSTWCFITMFFAFNPTPSYYEIGRYLLTLLLLYLITVAFRNNSSQLLKLCKFLLLASTIHSIVGVCQFYGIAFTDIPGGAGNPADPARIISYGLMANQNLFGSAQVLLLPFAVFVLQQGSKIWKSISVITLAGIVVSLLVSRTRSAWLAAVVFMMVTIALNILFSPSHRKAWIVGAFVSTISITSLVGLLLFTSQNAFFTKSMKQRAFSLIRPTADNVASSGRILSWKKSLLLIKDHPLTGVGLGNWRIAIPAYGSEGTSWASGLVLPSHPHNVYLEVASETGIPGAVLYFSLWIAVGVAAYTVIRKTKSKEDKTIIILVLSGLAAFATDSLFSFPTERLEHSLYFVLMAGIVLGYYTKLLDANPTAQPPRKSWLLIATAVCIAVFNVFMGYKKYSFEKHANKVKTARSEHNYADAIEEVEKGKSKWVTLDPAGELLEMQSSAAYVELGAYDDALREIVKAKSYHPNNARIWTTMGVIYANLHDYKKAIASYQQALQLAPGYDVALKNLAGIYFTVGNYAGCIKTIERMQSRSYFYMNNLYTEAQKRLEVHNK